MEFAEGGLLHDQKGIGFKEKVDNGHESHDEERKASKKSFQQSLIPSPPPPSQWLWRGGVRVLLQQQSKSCIVPHAKA